MFKDNNCINYIMSKVFDIEHITKYLTIFKNKKKELNTFLKSYMEIINEDNLKPLFSQTTRYNQFPKNKYIVNNQLKNPLYKKNKDAWAPNNNIETLVKKIKIILNKITNSNYDKLVMEFNYIITNLYTITDIEEITKYIYNKILKDKEFHSIYFKLCKTIWYNKTTKYNIINIVKKNNNYYWEYKNCDIKYDKKFNTIDSLKNNINNTINFKNILIRIINNIIYNKDEYF